MDEKSGDSVSFKPEEKNDCLYPMFFGVSCAFFALRLLPEPEICDEKWSEIRNRLLKGSAHLFGMFAWMIQKDETNIVKSELFRKLRNAQTEIEQIKKIRSEDAKANQKVVSIIAAREQTWFNERKRLRQHIGGLMNDLRVLEKKKDESISELNEKIKENENVLNSKDKSIEDEEKKRREVEEKLKKAEDLVDELRENVKSEAQKHSSEISKHKTAFIELVSNQRQLEAEMGRALRQVEAAKQEIDSVLEQKEQSVLMAQKLSLELVKMRKDLEQKDQILSAMLRKSKQDTAEKQMLLKEVKSSKAKRRQAELETARWKAASETKQERNSSRNMLSKHVSSKSDLLLGGKGGQSRLTMSLDAGNIRSAKTNYHMKFEQPEIRQGLEVFSVVSDPYLTDVTEEKYEIVDWISPEIEKYKKLHEQRHNLEIDAFTEQLRLKDEKLEAYRWRMLSMEIESKRLQSHIERLDHDITQLKQDNMKLESLLLDREAELHSLKEQLVLQFNPPNLKKLNPESSLREQAIAHDTVWSKVKVIKRKPSQEKREMKAKAEIKQEMESNKVDEIPGHVKDIVLTLQSSNKEIEERRDGRFLEQSVKTSIVPPGHGLGMNSNSTWKMDIHALGVSYKIKRLKQQLLMLERLTGKQESCENNDGCFGLKGFDARMSLLNKQIDRYQSLQGKTDDLCKRMHENNLKLKSGVSTIARAADETRKLEHFLEETFQVQRYIVATGQKLLEVQTKIASGFVGEAEEIEKPESFDMKRFADSVRTLFREVQRGLEVRISRIIGDLEGTLAFDGMKYLKN